MTEVAKREQAPVDEKQREEPAEPSWSPESFESETARTS
jgi:hypothetical protein